MSIRVSSTSLIAGAVVCGAPGLGVLAENVPSTGDAGAGYAYAYLSLPADNGKEVRGLIVTPPSAGTLTAYEDTSFVFEAPDGEYTFDWRMFIDGVDSGLKTETLIIGDAEVPPAVAPIISATTSFSSTSAVSATVTTDTAGGTIYGVLSDSATVMTAAAIKSGADDTATVTDAGDYTLDETGLATWTQYYWHIVHEDGAGLMSNVLTIPVRTLDLSIPLAFSDTAPATLLTVQVWSKVPKKADVEGLY